MEHGPGTNYFASLNGQVFISQTDQDGLAVLANCYGDPNSIALDPNIFAVGCQMIRKDILSGNNVYYNQGTVSSVSWVLSGGGGGGNSFDSNRNTTRAGIPIVDVGGTTVQEFLEGYFFPAVAPLISFSGSPAPATREKGDTISIALTAVTTEQTNPIVSVKFYKNSSLLYTDPSPSPTGGTSTYTDSGIADTVSYYATVSDGTLTTTSGTLNYPYVYPYYYGVGAPGLSPTAVAALTKLIQGKSNKTTTTSPTAQVYYFAYPAAYGLLTSILDTNGFETLGDYYQTTISITGLDGTAQSYYQYEFKHLTTQVNFNNTYKY